MSLSACKGSMRRRRLLRTHLRAAAITKNRQPNQAWLATTCAEVKPAAYASLYVVAMTP